MARVGWCMLLTVALGSLSACERVPAGNSGKAAAHGDASAVGDNFANGVADPYVLIADVPAQSLRNELHLRVPSPDGDDPFLAELYDFAIKHFPEGEWLNFGPDSSYRRIVFFSRGRKVLLESWHPTFEKDPRLVAGSRGITSLGTQTREEFLKQDDQAYVEKRNAFDEIESRLRKHYRD